MNGQIVLTAVVSVIVALASGGAINALIAARQAKRAAATPEARAAATVEGSAKAVLTMDQALDAANKRAAQAEKDVASLRSEIRQLRVEHRQEIDGLRAEHNREITDLRARFDGEIAALKAQVSGP